MKAIWKYPFLINDEIQSYEIPMPIGDGVLCHNVHVDMQGGSLCMWASVETENALIKCDFRVVGTGYTFEKGVRVGTAKSGPFVWHLILVDHKAVKNKSNI